MTAITKPLTEWNNKEILIFLYKTKVFFCVLLHVCGVRYLILYQSHSAGLM